MLRTIYITGITLYPPVRRVKCSLEIWSVRLDKRTSDITSPTGIRIETEIADFWSEQYARQYYERRRYALNRLSRKS